MSALWLLLLAFPMTACKRERAAAGIQPHQTMRGFTLSRSYRGSPAWNLTAEVAVLHDADQSADLEKPRMEFFKNGRVASRLASAIGSVKTDTYDVKMTGEVVATSLEDNSVLKTSELDYSSVRKKFITDKDVEVIRPDGVLRGRGLEASPDLSDIRIFNQRSVVTK